MRVELRLESQHANRGRDGTHESAYVYPSGLSRRDNRDTALPSNAPANAATPPTNAAITSSNGHKLCDVESPNPSNTTRTMTTAGTDEPMTAATRMKRLPE
jgi:hypothetical protein